MNKQKATQEVRIKHNWNGNQSGRKKEERGRSDDLTSDSADRSPGPGQLAVDPLGRAAGYSSSVQDGQQLARQSPKAYMYITRSEHQYKKDGTVIDLRSRIFRAFIVKSNTRNRTLAEELAPMEGDAKPRSRESMGGEENG
uniref:Uncharacterized protein n=1 Tax=Oryza barthii TaxID=65489 RepID=A0A0D3FEW0_9ORYZ